MPPETPICISTECPQRETCARSVHDEAEQGTPFTDYWPHARKLFSCPWHVQLSHKDD